MSRTSTQAKTTGPAQLREFDRSLPMALMRAREAVMQRFRPVLASHDLSEQQWRVLRALTSATTPLSAGELAGRTNLLAPSLSRMLTSLEGRSLISRAPGASDGRRSVISPTEQGHDLVRVIAPISEAAYATIERDLGGEQLQQLYDLLARLGDIDELR